MPLHTRERDSQRSKVYAAERAAFDLSPHSRKFDDPATFGRHGLSIEECQFFVDMVIESPWFAEAFEVSSRREPNIRVVATRGNGSARSYGGMYGGSIHVSRGGRREWVLLHEIAHNIRTGRDPYGASHGWAWAAAYVKLVQHYLGMKAAKALKAEFRARKVKYTEPRAKRKLSPEQAEANRARLAAYREQKAAEKAAAAAANPMKIELIKKGNFSAKHTWGVEFVVVDLDTEEIMIKRSQMQAGDARSYGMSMAKQFAEERPGHDMELVVTGFSKRHGEDMPDRSEIHRVRYEPELVMA